MTEPKNAVNHPWRDGYEAGTPPVTEAEAREAEYGSGATGDLYEEKSEPEDPTPEEIDALEKGRWQR